MHPLRARLAPAACALAALAGPSVGCSGGPFERVVCRDLESGYTARYRGADALARCLSDPAMQTDGHRREAVAGPGSFDFGAADRFELGSGFSIRGAGPLQTTLHASRPTTALFTDDLRSALWVRGKNVELSGFTFDGACRDGPSPAAGCQDSPDETLLGIVVACGYGFERGPDCDVDGLRIDDVRVLHVKTPFAATGSDPDREAGEKALFSNFRDFHWTIRRFQVSDRSDAYRYARVFELGNGATPEMSQGPGAGVAGPRRYVVDIEDTQIDTHVGRVGGELAGVLTMAVNAPVALTVNLRRSSLAGTERVVGIAAHTLEGPGRAEGEALLRCEDSQLLADQRDWASKVRARPQSALCPPFDAAVYVGEFSLPGGRYRTRAELVRCDVRTQAGLALCPPPASIDTGREALAAHVSVCTLESRLVPAARGAVEPVPCTEPLEERPASTAGPRPLPRGGAGTGPDAAARP